ncbi:MAG TPA: SusC/RagA family TonB-linked outer membrane protein [Longimicrobiales bacterium]
MRHRSWAARMAAVLFLATPGALVAQEATLQGRVTDAQGGPIVGATVMVRGTGNASFTDDAGRYLLSVSPGTHEIQASMIGHRPVVETVTLNAGETRTLDFTLELSAIELTEIVASVEAGEVTRREMGTDIASIDVRNQIENAVVTNISEMLNGRAGNVTITQASGNVGAGSRIRVRGINSLTQSNNPLVIIDGVRASNDTDFGINRGQTFSRFNDLDPSNIARIQVVKGPAALALYGSEAASGVIIIETKNGAAARDGMQISMQLQQGAMWDVADYPDHLADVTPFVTGPDDPKLAGWRVEEHPLTHQVFVVDNPFEDESTSPFRTGRLTNASVQISGRASSVSYFTSLGYDDETGVLPSNDLQRINFRANFQATPNEKVSVTASSGYITSTTNLPKSGNNTSGFFVNAMNGTPYSSKSDDGRCLATVLLGDDPSVCDKDGNVRAAFDKIAAIVSREDLERFTGSVRVNYTPFTWLTNSAMLGADIVDQVFNDAIPYDPEIPFSFAAGGEFFRSRNLRRHVTVDLSSTASYDITGSLAGRTAVGAQYFQNELESISCEGRIFVNDQANACDAGVSLRGFSDFSEKVEVGAYLQQRFDYGNYLFVTGALRVDDNSALGAEEPAIWSPSVNGSLVVSDLPMWNVDPGTVSQLRVRAAWGTATQSPVAYAAERTYSIVRLNRGGQIVPGLSPEDPGNPELGPERSSEIELGFDAGVLDDRIGVQFTYFRRTTKDAIVSRPVPPSSGFADNQLVNLGEVRNNGFEASINALLLDRRNMTWDATLTVSSTKSTVTDLGDLDGFGGFREGYPPDSYIDRVITHAERDADGNIIPESIEYAPGTLGDGSGRRLVGQGYPTNEESLLTTLTLFDNLRISSLFDRAAGHRVFSGTLSTQATGSTLAENSSFGRLWAYRQILLTPVEQATIEQDVAQGDFDLFWTPRADFIKFRELKVSYDLPTDLANRFGMSNATIYIGGRNLHTWTDFPGLDPEINQEGARDTIGALEANALPPARMFFSGIRVTF